MLRQFIIALALCLVGMQSHGALQGRMPATLGGTDYQAYYDTVLNVTWLADANLAATNDFFVSGVIGNGTMNWNTAQAWIAAMNGAAYLGVSTWRLPTVTDTGSTGCTFGNSGTDCGYNVNVDTGEMARMFYGTLANNSAYNTSGVRQPCADTPPNYCLNNPGSFGNLQVDYLYWSDTLDATNPTSRAWDFLFGTGRQYVSDRGFSGHAWPVAAGDPLPVAGDDQAVTYVNSYVRINIAQNDTGFSDPVTMSLFTPPVNGAVQFSGSPGPKSGIFATYTPGNLFLGADQFQYTITDGVNSGMATVTVFTRPRAVNDFVTINPNYAVAIPILANDLGMVGPFSASDITIGPGAAHGMVIVEVYAGGTAEAVRAIYQPDENYAGTDSFVYSVRTINGQSNNAAVFITVSGDMDGDGVVDMLDNCTVAANPAQLDADSDGYGNICDADLNNSGLTTSTDFSLLRSVLNQSSGSSGLAAAADMNGSGLVTSADFGLLRARLNTAPGPSGLHP